MLVRFLRVVGLWVCAQLLVPCGANVAIAEPPVYIEYGKVEAIDIYRAPDNDKMINPGTVIGGVAGGVIGHQIGSGRGNTAATIAGALGGAVIGNEIQKKQQVPSSRYRITVRLESGSRLIIEETREVDLRIGDHVRVENNHVYRM
jgi:uncharacterized protein YcfJ